MNGRFFRFLGLISLAALCVLGCGCQADSAKTADEGVAAGQVSAPPLEPAAADAAAVEPTLVDEPEPTAAVEPEPTAAVEPEPTAVAEPEPTAAVEPEPTAPDEPEPTAVAEPEPTAAAEPEAAAAAEPEPTAAVEPEPTAAVEPEAAGADGSEAAAENEPERVYTGPDLAVCEAVDDEFFADAAFLGNSLVDGLHRHGGLSRGHFFAATSASVVNVDMTKNSRLESGTKATLLSALTEKQYAKIYILLGINEIGFEPDYFSRLYGAMLDKIMEREPGADIYIMALSPVTEECSLGSDVFNMERVGLYNEALYALARDKQCYYVDLCQALAGEDGYLPKAESTDGIHLKAEKYLEWANYLRTHVKQ